MNENNLIYGSKLSQSEARENGAKGGRKSGETRRRKRDMKQKMKMLLELPCYDTDDWNEASIMGVDMEAIDNETVMLIGLFREAKKGNVSAVREIRNILETDKTAADKAEQKLRNEKLKAETDKLSGKTSDEPEVQIIDDI